MIKYLELTAPVASAFRQAKILSIECAEGDQIQVGTTLFRVKSGDNEIDLPSTREGRIVELIAYVGENITISTALLLLEMEVEGSTATPPINPEDSGLEQTALASEQPEPINEQPEPINEQAEPMNKQPEPVDRQPESVIKQPTENQLEADQEPVEHSPIKSPAEPTKNTPSKKTKRKTTKAKAHQQQMLNLSDDEPDETEQEQEQAKSSTQASIEGDNDAQELDQASSNAEVIDSANTQNVSMTDKATTQISVPDIGGDSANVIEILVQVGDQISAEDSIVTLESDKASMDVPSSHTGTVKQILVSIDQEVSEGTALLTLEAPSNNASSEEQAAAERSDDSQSPDKATPNTEQTTATDSSISEITIPDIGGDSAKVIEILVSVGDEVTEEDPLITLESDKASMDVPCPMPGTIVSIEVELDQDVSEGLLIATLRSSVAAQDETSDTSEASKTISSPELSVPKPSGKPETSAPTSTPQHAEVATMPVTGDKSHASPSIRRFARELGVELAKVNGSGRKNRITKDDVKSFVKDVITKKPQATGSSQSNAGGAGIPEVPAQDFSKFGEIEVVALNRIKKLTAINLHRSWLNVPHVTHNDEANINDLEAFRKETNQEYAKQDRGIKLSPLAFVVKAVVNGLRNFPQFNSSLEPGGENLIYKKYFNIGIAVDTPDGLVVPVIKDADKKSVGEIATEMGTLAEKARNKKLTMADMSGACFTISSLGGIGGTSFTPIVNAPEVAILGVSRSKMQPHWNGTEFIPAMMLPLSVSYDHRVIDGAEAARFTRHIAAALEDVRRLSL